MNWTDDEVIECDRSFVAAERCTLRLMLKAAKLDGAGLLEMRQNQNLFDDLTYNGLQPVVVHKLARADSASTWHQVRVASPDVARRALRLEPLLGLADSCIHPVCPTPHVSRLVSLFMCDHPHTSSHDSSRLSATFPPLSTAVLLSSPHVVLRCAEPTAIFITLSEAEGQGVRLASEDQKEMNRLMRGSPGTIGFIDCSSDVLVTRFEGLPDGNTAEWHTTTRTVLRLWRVASGLCEGRSRTSTKLSRLT